MTAPQDPFSTPPERRDPDDGRTPEDRTPEETQQGYDQPAYDQPAHGQSAHGQSGFGAPQRSTRNGAGVAALVLGLLALPGIFTIVFGLLFGLLAIIFGVLGRTRASKGEATNGGMALAGIVLGAVALLISIALIVFGVSILNSDEGQQYQDCLREAGNDQAAVAQCNEQFAENVTG